VITCGHTFCHFCIHEWTMQNPNCPICHKGIPVCCNSGLHKHVQIDNFIATIYKALGGDYLLTRLQLKNARAEQRCTSSSSFPEEATKQIPVNQKPLISSSHPKEPAPSSAVNQHSHKCIPHAEHAEQMHKSPTHSEDVHTARTRSKLVHRSNTRTIASVTTSTTSISNDTPVLNRGISSRTDRISTSQPTSYRSQPPTPTSDSSMSPSNHPAGNYTVPEIMGGLLYWIFMLLLIRFLI
jgi:hypothetical protein